MTTRVVRFAAPVLLAVMAVPSADSSELIISKGALDLSTAVPLLPADHPVGHGAIVTLVSLGFAAAPAEPKAAQRNTTVREGQAVKTELSGTASAITYWINEADGWHVVTTVDTLIEHDGECDKHAIVGFSSVLLPGQSQTISVPSPIGQGLRALRFRRLGDQLEIERVPASA